MTTNNTQKTATAPGAETVEITVATIEGYLKTDLTVAINCLDAIYRDPDLLRSMASFLHGRYINDKNSKAQAQPQEQ